MSASMWYAYGFYYYLGINALKYTLQYGNKKCKRALQ